MRKTIYTNTFPQGNPANGLDQVRDLFTMIVYQGDTGDMQFMDSVVPEAGAAIPTGSICYVENNIAKPGKGADSGVKVFVPYIVKVGNDKKSVKSEKYNAAGNLLTLLPLTGYFRCVTSVCDTTATYERGTLLTVGEVTVGGKTYQGVKPATATTDMIVGIADGPTDVDIKGNKAVKFTAFYRPATT